MKIKRSEIYERNNFSKRLKWVREQLGVKASVVADMVPMPVCSLFLLETRSRTPLYEQIQRIAYIYNELWKIEFKERFPKHQGEKVEEISFLFLCFGHDEYKDHYEGLIEQVKRDYDRKLEEIKKAWGQ